jgi:hypothetical protein
MTKRKRHCMASLTTFLAAACLAGTAMAQNAGTPSMNATAIQSAAAQAKPMTHAELLLIYSNQTWQWENGAGYFASGKRQFEGWSGSGASSSFAEGVWFLRESGIMCMRANWSTVNGAEEVVTCFQHRSDEDYIFQRRLPDGGWYLFGDLPRRTGHELEKFAPGNRLGEGMKAARDFVAGNATVDLSDPARAHDATKQIYRRNYELFKNAFCGSMRPSSQMQPVHPACI